MTTTTNSKAPIIDGAAHAWVVNNPQFPLDPDVATCPENMPTIDESAEHLIARMSTFGIDQTVISHVCYYGRDKQVHGTVRKGLPGPVHGSGPARRLPSALSRRPCKPGEARAPDA